MDAWDGAISLEKTHQFGYFHAEGVFVWIANRKPHTRPADNWGQRIAALF